MVDQFCLNFTSVAKLALGTFVLVGTLGATGRCDAATANVVYTVNGGPVNTLSIAGVTTMSGNQWFNASIPVDGGTMTWNYVGDVNPHNAATLNGSTTIKNDGTSAMTVSVEFDVAICPAIVADVTIGGTATLKLVSNADGGVLACGSGDDTLVSAVSDGKPAATLYYCPFWMAESGAGTIGTSIQFGTPFPSMPGPEKLGSLGHRFSVLISPGEKVIMSLLYIADGITWDAAMAPCAADVDGSELVDTADLLAVLEAFGSAAGCGNPVDVNGDGTVNGVDLATVIGAWGPCPH